MSDLSERDDMNSYRESLWQSLNLKVAGVVTMGAGVFVMHGARKLCGV